MNKQFYLHKNALSSFRWWASSPSLINTAMIHNVRVHFNMFSELTSSLSVRLYVMTEVHPYIINIDVVCAFIFVVELVVRLMVWPNKFTFITSFFNIMDILAVIPMLITNIIIFIDPQFWLNQELQVSYVKKNQNYIMNVMLLKCVFIQNTPFSQHRVIQIRVLEANICLLHFNPFATSSKHICRQY